jgi:hypothetical protein
MRLEIIALIDLKEMQRQSLDGEEELEKNKCEHKCRNKRRGI